MIQNVIFCFIILQVPKYWLAVVSPNGHFSSQITTGKPITDTLKMQVPETVLKLDTLNSLNEEQKPLRSVCPATPMLLYNESSSDKLMIGLSDCRIT